MEVFIRVYWLVQASSSNPGLVMLFCHCTGEVAAHKSSINTIAVNQDAVFTGSR